ncbi:MAG: hypothetical protein ACYDA1_06565 [Vulcanimicrobiaceae bacterium]
MASQDHFAALAAEIQGVLNTHSLAFKTYQLNELTERFKSIAGSGSRIDDKTAPDFEKALLERGFLCFPAVADAVVKDGYVRIIRAGSLVANLLAAFRYPGSNGDTQLAQILTRIKSRPDASQQVVDEV